MVLLILCLAFRDAFLEEHALEVVATTNDTHFSPTDKINVVSLAVASRIQLVRVVRLWKDIFQSHTMKVWLNNRRCLVDTSMRVWQFVIKIS